MSSGRCYNSTFTPDCGLVASPNAVNTCLYKGYELTNGDQFGWGHGLTSRCFPVTYQFATKQWVFPAGVTDGTQDALCYPSSCTAAGELFVTVLGQSVLCPTGELCDAMAVCRCVVYHYHSDHGNFVCTLTCCANFVRVSASRSHHAAPSALDCDVQVNS